jgi:oxalate---CoA ligase
VKEQFNKSKYRLKNKSQRYLNLPHNYLLHVTQQLLETDQHIEIISVNTQALSKYSFPVYPGRVVLLRTEDQSRFNATGLEYDPLLGWGDIVTGSLEIQYIPGAHLSIFNEPYVEVLAEKFQDCLNKAQADVLKRSREIEQSLSKS